MSLLVPVVALLLACGSDDPTSETDEVTTTTVSTGDTAPAPLAECDRLDGPPRPFDPSEGGLGFGELAGDFTIEELDGSTWTLSEAWTGCDVYLFVAYHGAVSDGLWASDPNALIKAAPRNTHVFFVSDEDRRADRKDRLEELEGRLDLNESQAARVHLVVNRLTKIDGSVGAMTSDYAASEGGFGGGPDLQAFGIDATQRWDPGGSLAQYVGGPELFEMAGYLGHFYNHKANLAHRLDGEDATVVTLLDERVSDRIFVVEPELPALEGFDTLEVDVEVTCPARNPFDCSEWDRIARIEVCVDGAECADRRELVRWITPYWRRGTRRWAIDASALLPLLDDAAAFRIEMGPDWEAKTERDARFALRLSTRGTPRARGAVRVFTGGVFDAYYDDGKPPIDVDVPADATRVELVAIVSGHGQDGATNCAEWCDHRHTFAVAGTELPTIAHEGGIGLLPGCAERAKDGVPPGQWGNWAPSRAYWCPGLPVAPIVLDATAATPTGGPSTWTYSANREGTFSGGGGDIDLSAYVVWY